MRIDVATKALVQGTIACALAALSAACAAGTAGTLDARAPATAVEAAPAAANATASEGVVVGPTEGESSDPLISAWQNEMLDAMGRKGQHALFSLLLVESDRQQVYVGVDAASLGLSPEERKAAEAVQAKYAASPLRASTRGGRWVVEVVREHGAVASSDTTPR